MNRTPRHTDLTDAQWEALAPVVPEPPRRKDGRGRPWKERRAVLNGILYILCTGAAWADLPDRYPPYQTCHRRFQQWVKSGVFGRIIQVLSEEVPLRGEPDVGEMWLVRRPRRRCPVPLHAPSIEAAVYAESVGGELVGTGLETLDSELAAPGSISARV